jgi:putative RNA ligase
MIDWDLVDRMVSEKFITARPHHALPLTIYNYTPSAQFGKVWNAATLICRGLVATQCSERRVVARPFPKFFNIEEYEQEHLADTPIPQEPFSVFEKYDGSLFIVSKYNDQLVASTRGSFGSPQAARALKMLEDQYGTGWVKPEWTYLFEILYPENRIVVDYGDREDLVFLAAVNTATGEEILPPQGHIDAGVPEEMEQAKVYPINCLEQLQKIEEENREGFIVRFQSGLRVKVKFDGYKRLHKLITGLSEKAVWEHLFLGDAAKLDTFKVNVPDEFHAWLDKTISTLQSQFDAILATGKAVFDQETAGLSDPLGKDRKLVAQRFNQRKAEISPSVLFSLLTGKKLDSTIWKMIKPRGDSVFRKDTDESVNDDQAG